MARNRRPWTDADVEALHNEFPHVKKVGPLARQLRRTEGSVRQKACALGIKRTTDARKPAGGDRRSAAARKAAAKKVAKSKATKPSRKVKAARL